MRIEYENYMKRITDGFADLCSFSGAEAILAGEGNKISVMIYKNKEFLIEYDKDLKHIYRNESYNERIKEFHKKRQEIAEKFLNENKLTYDEWYNKNILETYNWIKVKKYKDDPNLSWEERYKQLEIHHIEETTFLINKIRENITSEK